MTVKSSLTANWTEEKPKLHLSFDFQSCPQRRGERRVTVQTMNSSVETFRLSPMKRFEFISSHVLLLGKSVRRHPRGRGWQALYRRVFEDGRCVGGGREGVFGRGGAAAAGRCGRLWLVGLLRQEGQGRVDGRGVGLWVVLLVTGQSVAHIVGRVWKLLIKPSCMLPPDETQRHVSLLVLRVILRRTYFHEYFTCFSFFHPNILSQTDFYLIYLY